MSDDEGIKIAPSAAEAERVVALQKSLGEALERSQTAMVEAASVSSPIDRRKAAATETGTALDEASDSLTKFLALMTSLVERAGKESGRDVSKNLQNLRDANQTRANGIAAERTALEAIKRALAGQPGEA